MTDQVPFEVVLEIVTNAAREHIGLGLPDLDHDCDLYDAGLDSLGAVGLLVACEEALNVTIPDELLEREIFATPASLAHVLVDAISRRDVG